LKEYQVLDTHGGMAILITKKMIFFLKMIFLNFKNKLNHTKMCNLTI